MPGSDRSGPRVPPLPPLRRIYAALYTCLHLPRGNASRSRTRPTRSSPSCCKNFPLARLGSRFAPPLLPCVFVVRRKERVSALSLFLSLCGTFKTHESSSIVIIVHHCRLDQATRDEDIRPWKQREMQLCLLSRRISRLPSSLSLLARSSSRQRVTARSIIITRIIIIAETVSPGLIASVLN